MRKHLAGGGHWAEARRASPHGSGSPAHFASLTARSCARRPLTRPPGDSVGMGTTLTVRDLKPSDAVPPNLGMHGC